VRPKTRAALAAPLAVLLAVGAAGCGLGPGAGTNDVRLTVTRGFGQRRVDSISQSKVPGSETVMRMLQRFFHVRTRYGGGFVQSIEGFSGKPPRLDWFYYINGIQASRGAAATVVHRGDSIWWDLHDWSAAESVPAVVGSFPEPFLHGSGGRRLPTTVECGRDVQRACRAVSASLAAAGVPVASQLLGTGSGTDSLPVLVGTWPELGQVIAARLIERGPAASGVYARFSNGASALQLLGARGDVRGTLHAGAGLVAATARSDSNPTWLVTGTDRAGVLAAANALRASRLRDHFALATSARGDEPLPLASPR
jgi:hypothetical protein